MVLNSLNCLFTTVKNRWPPHPYCTFLKYRNAEVISERQTNNQYSKSTRSPTNGICNVSRSNLHSCTQLSLLAVRPPSVGSSICNRVTSNFPITVTSETYSQLGSVCEVISIVHESQRAYAQTAWQTNTCRPIGYGTRFITSHPQFTDQCRMLLLWLNNKGFSKLFRQTWLGVRWR